MITSIVICYAEPTTMPSPLLMRHRKVAPPAAPQPADPLLDEAGARAFLLSCIQVAGSQRLLSGQIKISQPVINYAATGKRPMSAALAAALGLEKGEIPRQTRYRRQRREARR